MLTTIFWRKYFEVYDNLNVLLPYHNLLVNMVSIAKIMPKECVLDLGSGTGNLSIIIEKAGANVTGVDFSTAGIDIHKKKSPRAKLINHDITKKLPFGDECFDVVVSNNVLYTISRNSREAIYSEIFRVTKPGGRVVLSNLIVGFSPGRIYLDHVKESLKIYGVIKTVITLVKLILPTIKIFYYNFLIKMEGGEGNYDFFAIGEQKKSLESSGFINASRDIYDYSDQAITTMAYK